MKRTLITFLSFLLITGLTAQNIRVIYHNVNNGQPSLSVNQPGTILYPTGYNAYDYKTPVIFVHGFTGKLTGSYEANIQEVVASGLHAAFVQLKPMGTPEENGMLLKKMIDQVAAHFGSATVSIVAHSKGGMDTERALYGHNPYNYSIPSFGYEKVDGVYTFGSPLRGSRLADVGEALSWTGIAWIAMWYTNGFYLTSASVQEFHNWAQSWRINSDGTFRNYYNPNGASYSRINMIEDNTTRWWAHQSDDPCYEDRWYFCYVGNAFHHSAGAYYDAYWEWDWFNSGWRNWHTENDGFIAVYRAKRQVNQNASPALTPGAGDSNYITMNDADHISLWDPNQGHFRDEVLPYLHLGLYGNTQYRPSSSSGKANKEKFTGVHQNPVYVSNGMFYTSKNGQTNVIVENNNAEYEWVVLSDHPVQHITLHKGNRSFDLNAEDYYFDKLANAFTTYFQSGDLEKGIYTLTTNDADEIIVFSRNLNPVQAFAVKWNWDENKGYEGKPIEVKIAGLNSQDLENVQVVAELTRISGNGKPVQINRLKKQNIIASPVPGQTGYYKIHLPRLVPGEHYAIRVKAILENGQNLLARNAITTVYVPEQLATKEISVSKQTETEPAGMGSLDIYPNPATDYTVLRLPFEGEKNIRVTGLSGKVLEEFKTDQVSLKLNVNKYHSGTYLIQVMAQGKIFTTKLIVK